MPKLMIYGATGYTGRMVSRRAKELHLDFIIAGRSDKIKDLAASLNAPSLLFDMTSPQQTYSALKGISVLLNCAGPFMHTAEPLMKACIQNGVHYLDIAAELDSYRHAERLDQEAKDANVMLLPGCGGSVAMLGCLAGHVVEKLQDPSSIDVALHVSGAMSRGSAVSAVENMTAEVFQRINGDLEKQENAAASRFNFEDGKGDVVSYPITLPDLITIWKSTKVPNIRTFVHASGDAFQTGDLSSLPDGPTDEERDANPYHAAVLITASDGSQKRAVLHTVNGYTFTSLASAEAATRVVEGETRGGFQTPALIFGNKFVESIPGSIIEDY